jgi:hypothetical protein
LSSKPVIVGGTSLPKKYKIILGPCVVGIFVCTHAVAKIRVLELVVECFVKGKRFIEEIHWMALEV